MPKTVEEQPGISRKEISAKYRTRQRKFPGPGETNVKIQRESIERAKRNAGKPQRYIRGKWYDREDAPEERGRKGVDWGRHLVEHELLLKQVADGTYDR